jgi:hypothetical protein
MRRIQFPGINRAVFLCGIHAPDLDAGPARGQQLLTPRLNPSNIAQRFFLIPPTRYSDVARQEGGQVLPPDIAHDLCATAPQNLARLDAKANRQRLTACSSRLTADRGHRRFLGRAAPGDCLGLQVAKFLDELLRRELDFP